MTEKTKGISQMSKDTGLKPATLRGKFRKLGIKTNKNGKYEFGTNYNSIRGKITSKVTAAQKKKKPTAKKPVVRKSPPKIEPSTVSPE